MAEPAYEDIRNRVLDVVSHSPLAPVVADVHVLPAQRDEDDIFVWVRLKMLQDRVDTDAGIDLMRGIEEAVTGMSDRFPSVYFDKAA